MPPPVDTVDFAVSGGFSRRETLFGTGAEWLTSVFGSIATHAPILSPVLPSLAGPHGRHIALEEPYERRVTQTLARALRSVRQAAEDAATTGRVDHFVEAVPSGVSANLCDALAGMGSFGEGNRALGIQLSWSRHRPLAPQLRLPNEIVFYSDVFPALRQAAVYLKESSPREEFEIRGLVVKRDRPEATATGKITIYGLIDDQPRKVAVESNDADYRRAVTAHDQGRLVQCSGVLIREGQRCRESPGADTKERRLARRAAPPRRPLGPHGRCDHHIPSWTTQPDDLDRE